MLKAAIFTALLLSVSARPRRGTKDVDPEVLFDNILRALPAAIESGFEEVNLPSLDPMKEDWTYTAIFINDNDYYYLDLYNVTIIGASDLLIGIPTITKDNFNQTHVNFNSKTGPIVITAMYVMASIINNTETDNIANGTFIVGGTSLERNDIEYIYIQDENGLYELIEIDEGPDTLIEPVMALTGLSEDLQKAIDELGAQGAFDAFWNTFIDYLYSEMDDIDYLTTLAQNSTVV